MLLRHRLQNPQGMLSMGGVCLAAAIIAQRFIHPSNDFWQGIIIGVSGVLVGLSIVLNVRGLMLQRRDREDGKK